MPDVLAPPAHPSGDGQADGVPVLGRAGWNERDVAAPTAIPTAALSAVSSAVPPDPFRAFLHTHQRALYALAHRLTGEHHAADDLVQETFVRAWTAMERGTVPEVPEAWLRRIAVRQFLSTTRGSLARRIVRWTDEALHRLPDAAPPPPDATFPGAFARALNRLSERERAAFVLRHVEDRSTRDTADELGIAEGTVKALLARAVAKMQTSLEPYA